MTKEQQADYDALVEEHGEELVKGYYDIIGEEYVNKEHFEECYHSTFDNERDIVWWYLEVYHEWDSEKFPACFVDEASVLWHVNLDHTLVEIGGWKTAVFRDM